MPVGAVSGMYVVVIQWFSHVQVGVYVSGAIGSDGVTVVHELLVLSVLARIRLNGRPHPVVVAVFLFLSFLLLVVTGGGVVVFGAALVGAAVPVPDPFPVFSLMICLASCKGTIGVVWSLSSWMTFSFLFALAVGIGSSSDDDGTTCCVDCSR